MKTVISVTDLTYKANKQKIVDNISFFINRGDFTCFMGPNGAGKSTVIKLLCGLLKPYSGIASVMGKEIGAYNRKKLAALISYVPQFSSGSIHFSVEEYIATGRYPHQDMLRGVSFKDKECVAYAMEVTSVIKMRNRDISTLSGGERQRVMIAAALAQEADILLLDEPTIYLDPKSSMDILELLAKIHACGTTVVMVTHDINQALMFGTGFIGIKKGAILFSETNPEKLADSGKLDELFDTRFYKTQSCGIPQLLSQRSGI